MCNMWVLKYQPMKSFVLRLIFEFPPEENPPNVAGIRLEEIRLLNPDSALIDGIRLSRRIPPK